MIVTCCFTWKLKKFLALSNCFSKFRSSNPTGWGLANSKQLTALQTLMTPFNRLQCVIDFLLCSINPVRNNWFMSNHASSCSVNRSNYQSTCSSHDYVSDSEENICSIQMQIIRHAESWCLGLQELEKFPQDTWRRLFGYGFFHLYLH